MNEKSNQFNLPVFIISIENKMTLERLKQNKHWVTTFEKGFPAHIIRVKQTLYTTLK
jgi:hypothetical protein